MSVMPGLATFGSTERFMQGRVSSGKQRSQEVLLNAGRTRVIVTIPEWVPRVSQHDFALGIPTHRA